LLISAACASARVLAVEGLKLARERAKSPAYTRQGPLMLNSPGAAVLRDGPLGRLARGWDR